jgi:uncharacterized membrane protein YhaH (DUF805 family)
MNRWFLNFSFDGRARRSHTWANYFAWLGVIVVLIVGLSVVSAQKNPAATSVVALLLVVAALASVLDHMAMTFRRAHDTNKSGWIWVMLLIPLVNLLALYWLLIEDSNSGPNRYGPPVKSFYVPPSASAVAP